MGAAGLLPCTVHPDPESRGVRGPALLGDGGLLRRQLLSLCPVPLGASRQRAGAVSACAQRVCACGTDSRTRAPRVQGEGEAGALGLGGWSPRALRESTGDGRQRLSGQGICSPDTVTGLVIGDHTAEGRTDIPVASVAAAGPGGNLASTQWSNRAGRRSRSGEKGSSAYNGCKAAKLGPPGCLHCLWPGAEGPASVPAGPLPPRSPRGPQTWGG